MTLRFCRHRRSLTAPAALLALSLSLLIPACGKGPGAGTQPAANGPKPVPVTVAPAQDKQDLQRAVPVVGSLAPQERTVISNRVAGIVTKLSADLGVVVKPSQKLAELDSDRFQLQIKQATEALQENLARLGLKTIPTDEAFNVDSTSPVQKALSDLEAAKIKFDRAVTLYKQNLMKDFEYLDIQAGMKVAETSLQAARDDSRARLAAARQASTFIDLRKKDLADTTIVAPDGKTPIPGVQIDSYAVAERKVSIGEYLREGTPMFTLVADRTLKLQARVPERSLAEVKLGQTVTFKVMAYGERLFTGKITAIDPDVDVSNRTFLIEATVDNREGLLRSGSFVPAQVLTRTEHAVMVPVDALTSFAGVTKLFVLDASAKKVRQVEVTTGQQEGALIEIPKGVAPGDKVVITGQTKLVDGSPVEVRATAPESTTQTAAAETK